MANAKGLANIFTKEKLVELYFEKGLSWKQIANVYGCKPTNLAYYFRKFGLKGRPENGSFIGGKPWNKGLSVKAGTLTKENYLEGIRRSRKYGTEHWNYKGGWNQNGYRYMSINGEDVQEHRYVMEQALGRRLGPDEIVHHINHDKTDNRIENLMLTNRSEHVKIHPAWRDTPETIHVGDEDKIDLAVISTDDEDEEDGSIPM